MKFQNSLARTTNRCTPLRIAVCVMLGRPHRLANVLEALGPLVSQRVDIFDLRSYSSWVIHGLRQMFINHHGRNFCRRLNQIRQQQIKRYRVHQNAVSCVARMQVVS